MMDVTGGFGALPTRNNQAVQFEQSDKLNAKTMKSPNENGHVNLIQNAACFSCTIGCGRRAARVRRSGSIRSVTRACAKPRRKSARTRSARPKRRCASPPNDERRPAVDISAAGQREPLCGVGRQHARHVAAEQT